MDISTFLISKPYPKKYSQGLSIIEIMVALVISSILMAGVYTIFNNSKKTYILQGEMAELNDNARFIMDELKHVISKAGYAGCQPPQTYTNPFQNSLDNQTIQGISSSTAFPASDILDINNFFQSLDGIIDPDDLNAPINLDTNSLVPEPGDTIFISNCNFGPDSYTISTITPAADLWANPTINVGPLKYIYEPPYDIYMQNQLTYRVDVQSGEFRLLKCNTDINNVINCNSLVEGVQNMQIRYGIDTDITPDFIPNEYVDADNITNRVISIRVTLLMRTLKKRGIGTPGNPKTFNLDSNLSYNPHEANTEREDGYRHRLFTTTIFVRNSIYPL